MSESDPQSELSTDKAVITPGANIVVLSDSLVKQIRRHFKKDRENRFELFLLSNAIREKYLDQTTGDYCCLVDLDTDLPLPRTETFT